MEKMRFFTYRDRPLKGVLWKNKDLLLTFFLSPLGKKEEHFYKEYFSLSFEIHIYRL